MSFVDSLKKGLFGSEDDYDDQYMDDGPQMVNNNSGRRRRRRRRGRARRERSPQAERQSGQHPCYHPAQGRSGQARAL